MSLFHVFQGGIWGDIGLSISHLEPSFGEVNIAGYEYRGKLRMSVLLFVFMTLTVAFAVMSILAWIFIDKIKIPIAVLLVICLMLSFTSSIFIAKQMHQKAETDRAIALADDAAKLCEELSALALQLSSECAYLCDENAELRFWLSSVGEATLLMAVAKKVEEDGIEILRPALGDAWDGSFEGATEILDSSATARERVFCVLRDEVFGEILQPKATE